MMHDASKGRPLPARSHDPEVSRTLEGQITTAHATTGESAATVHPRPHPPLTSTQHPPRPTPRPPHRTFASADPSRARRTPTSATPSSACRPFATTVPTLVLALALQAAALVPTTVAPHGSRPHTATAAHIHSSAAPAAHSHAPAQPRLLARPLAPTLVAELGGRLHGLATDERYVYLSHHSRLLVLDPTLPPDAAPIGRSAPTGPSIGHLAARDGIVVGAGLELVVWDARDPRDIALIARVPLEDNVKALAWVGDEAWILDGSRGLTRFDLRDPARPRSLGRWRPPQFPDSAPARVLAMASLGDSALLSVWWDSMGIISDTLEVARYGPSAAAAPVALGSFSVPDRVLDLAIHGDSVLALGRGRQLWTTLLSPSGAWSPLASVGALGPIGGHQDLVFDGERVWHLDQAGRLVRRMSQGEAWEEVLPAAPEPSRLHRIAALPGEGRRLLGLGDTRPAWLSALGARPGPALGARIWLDLLPTREGAWLIDEGASALAFAPASAPAQPLDIAWPEALRERSDLRLAAAGDTLYATTAGQVRAYRREGDRLTDERPAGDPPRAGWRGADPRRGSCGA